MILFNTTFCVDANIAPDFIEYVREAYIPIAEASDLHSALLTEVRVPDGTDTRGINGQPTRSLALQMRAPSERILEEFRRDVLPNIYHSIGSQWGMGVAMFESTLDVLHDPSRK